MPKFGVGIPLIQLYGSTILPAKNSFQSPYDMIYNLRQGVNCLEIYGDLLNSYKNSLPNNLIGYANLNSSRGDK